MSKVVKLKRAIIKEELVAITGDFQKAVILNQLIYWSERVNDFDEFIKQENRRAVQHGLEQQDLSNGWIYKTAEELSTETMLGLSVASMRSHIKVLIDLGFISERNNPKYKWDKTKQYRVNLVEIVKRLAIMGYSLEGYKVDVRFLETKNGSTEIENGDNENSTAIPEITPKTMPKTTTKIDIEGEQEIEQPQRTKKHFTPPTLEEIQAYCIERKNNVDPQKFYDYFTASDWYDSKGSKVRSWKQKVITWESYSNKGNQRQTNGVKYGENGIALSNDETGLDDVF